MTRAFLTAALAPLRARRLLARDRLAHHRAFASRAGAAAADDDVVRVGDVVRVECLDVASTGEGVCRLSNGVVFLCVGATPGEVVEATVTKVMKSLARGAKTRTIKPSVHAVEARCPHYATCGGCVWQHLSYDEQVRHKRDLVVDAMTRIGKWPASSDVVGSCVGAVETYEYRNKMEFAFASTSERGGVDVGLRPRGSNDSVVDLSAGSALQSDEANAALMAVRETLRRLGGRVEAFDRTTGAGTLRSVTFRSATASDGVRSVMVDFATTAKGGELTEGPIAELVRDVSSIDAVSSVVHTSVSNEAELRRTGGGRKSKFVKGRKSNANAKKKVTSLYGENVLVETLDGLQFELSSASFFQTNTKQAETLVRKMREACGFSGNKTEIVLDLFCGAGTLGLSVASEASRVMGWEVVPEAVENAKRNAEINDIANADFFRVDLAKLNASKGAQGLLKTADGKNLPMPDIVITDPARPGMDAALIDILRKIGAKRIVYVSCNPSTQARDVLALTSSSTGPGDTAYELKSCTPVDMFPHTPHVESIVVLDRVVNEM